MRSDSAPEIGELVEAAQLGRERARQVSAGSSERRLLFVLRISGFLVGLPAASVQSVIAADTPCPLPMAPAHVLGLVPHSEGALAVIDLARFLGLPPIQLGASANRLVVVRSGELEAGIACDQALGVHGASGDELAQEFVIRGGKLATYTVSECQLGMGRVASLDLTRLLQDMRLRA